MMNPATMALRPTTRVVFLLLVALLGVMGISCAQLLGGKTKIRERRQFIIEAEPLHLPLPFSERPYEYRVQLDEFSVSRFYDRDQIVYRLSPAEIRFDRYNVWGVRPSDMITDAVQTYLREVQLFTDTRREFLDASPDYHLTGSVRAIERYDSGDRWYVRLDVSMQLVNRQNQIIWQMEFDPVEEQVFDPDPVFSVRAMRELLRFNMERAIRDLDRTMLIRKLQTEGRDITFLLDAAHDTVVVDTTEDDASHEMPRATKDYIVLPGTLVGEERSD